jgi:hypothetical protein
MQLSKPPKPKATRKRLKKEILSDDFKKRKMFWKNIAENFLENCPYGNNFYGKFSTSHHYHVAISTSVKYAIWMDVCSASPSGDRGY